MSVLTGHLSHTINPEDMLTLVIDQGSHASRMAVFTAADELIQLESINISTHTDTDNHYEQDANEILHSVTSLLEKLPADQIHNIRGCGICTQRSSIIAWSRSTGEALSTAISWRDLRNQSLVKRLFKTKSSVRRISGLPLTAHYSASKIRWLLENNDRVKQAELNRDLCISPIASFLLFHLLKEQPCLIDHSNAQRSQLFDISTLNWSEELLALFQINQSCLPECRPVIHHYGYLKHMDIPITVVCGDQNAALHAYPPLTSNNALVNIGTGAFVLSKSDIHQQPSALLCSIASSQNTQQAIQVEYITEGTVNGAGAALDWAQNKLPYENLFNSLPEWLDKISNPPVFINTVSGLGSPWWCDAGPPVFLEESQNLRSTGIEDRYVAIIESIVFLIFNNLEQLKTPPRTLYLSGGLSQLNGLCQKLADLSRSEVLRFSEKEASAYGCACLVKQYFRDNQTHCLTADIESKFTASENSKLINRYQQFVGELNKRCNSN